MQKILHAARNRKIKWSKHKTAKYVEKYLAVYLF